MTTMNAAQLLKSVQKEQILQEKQKAIKNPRRFIKMARDRGYKFTVKNLKAELEKLSEAELSALMNPGVGPRQHLLPR